MANYILRSAVRQCPWPVDPQIVAIATKKALFEKAFIQHKDAIIENLSRLKVPALVEAFTSKILTREEFIKGK